MAQCLTFVGCLVISGPGLDQRRQPGALLARPGAPGDPLCARQRPQHGGPQQCDGPRAGGVPLHHGTLRGGVH